ncbi:MAG: response regulator [Thaumarchaeota archaeon]|nr:response regulator [Nitrososphaerota archaeon]
MTTAIVVDDDIDTCDVLTEFLEFKDIEVLGIGYDGKEAVDLYQKHNPDIVFLDIMMPHYDGFYGLEKIKQLNPAAYVIIVTGDLTAETYNRLKLLKSSAIIYKPFDIEKIMDVVKQVCKEKLCNMVMQGGS